MHILLEIARLPARDTYQFGSVVTSWGDAGQVGIDFALEFGIGEELDQPGAAGFSVPRAQRALQSVTMVRHDFYVPRQDLGSPWAGV